MAEQQDQYAIEMDDVCFAYERQEVLHNVSLRIAERDLVALVGPNGGGKTTLLKLMLGLLRPRYGTVRIFGGTPEAARPRIGYVAQHLHFDPQFPVTALDVVSMSLVGQVSFGGIRGRGAKQAQAALQTVGLEELGRRPFAELSGGERQRVMIAQALVCEPELLLLDEPTANVDFLVEHQLYDLLKQLNQRLTIVLVSHNVNVVTRHVSHVVCVNRTAVNHPIDKMHFDILQEVYGGDMAVLRHDSSCHVNDPSGPLHAPHRADHPHHHHGEQ